MPHSEAPAVPAEDVAAGDAHADAEYPRVIPRDQHCISRKHINPNALKVLYRLSKAGYQAHLVGGGVRDLLLGEQPKDFDVATDATPDEVRALFRNCRLIGRRFRLAHVIFGREVVEVATFRAHHRGGDGDEGEVHDDGRILRDNVFGTIEEDAFRRDFTVNALYYDISRFAVLDYTGAMADLEARRLRLIGDPGERYREDPVRMLRAARFAAKLGFEMDPGTAGAIAELGGLLRDIPASRLFDEVLKLFVTGHALRSLEQLRRHDLLGYLFPAADAALERGDEGFAALLEAVLANTDRRLAESKPVTPAFIYAAFLWPRALAIAAELRAQGEPPVMAMQRAAARAADEQQAHTSLPKRFSGPMREIWILQPKLEGYRGKRARRLLAHPRLRAAWDFLCLRRDAGEDLAEVCEWWRQAMEADAGGGEAPAERAPGARARTAADGGGRRRRRWRARGRGGRRRS
ncbi:MAG: polynucleotide adenylyltransferase PcnB [Halofilum sp. (in: g-proteobacteria)]|nr:polynucleotide adenylyltransferase PcnB [Halofilum sp. (in: g-proteobacteria)]